MNVTTVSRDPFARTELRRYVIEGDLRRPCRNCGKANARFVYFTDADGAGRRIPRPYQIGVFCSISCHRDYYPQ